MVVAGDTGQTDHRGGGGVWSPLGLNKDYPGWHCRLGTCLRSCPQWRVGRSMDVALIGILLLMVHPRS